MAQIHDRILEVLQRYAEEGISDPGIRKELGLRPEEQNQLQRRRRDLYATHLIASRRVGSETRYFYQGRRAAAKDTKPINKRLRFQAIHASHGRCQMCGRSSVEVGVTLVVDHKIPRDWGGKTEPENLWALCEDCNAGKKNLFSSVDSPVLRKAIQHQSVHVRIGELLKGFIGKTVPSSLLELVADQDDWKKRTRELRYLGWEILVTKKKLSSGRVRSFYTLERFSEWPEDPSGWIQEYERKRAVKNRSARR